MCAIRNTKVNLFPIQGEKFLTSFLGQSDDSPQRNLLFYLQLFDTFHWFCVSFESFLYILWIFYILIVFERKSPKKEEISTQPLAPALLMTIRNCE